MNLRKSAFSGSWYPSDAKTCEKQIRQYLAEGKSHTADITHPVGGVVPHAGWYFSGAIACNVIHRLAQPGEVDTVMVFGMHMHERSSRTMMPEGSWETPFGPMTVDAELAEELIRQYPFQRETPNRFQQDNTIELQMPFIRFFFPEARVVAMGVPPVAETLDVARSTIEIAKRLGRHVVVIGSTDLTHYGPNYGFTAKGHGKAAVDWVRDHNDRRVIDAMIRMDPMAVLHESQANENACCGGAAAAAIAAGKAIGAKRAEQLVYATSYDKSPGDSFVGYVGILF